MKKQMKILMFSTALTVALSAQALAAGMLDLPRTGQTRCYNTAGSEIACSGSGQDGATRTGVPIPVPRFQDNADGTVTDKLTGLIWLKNGNCFGAKKWADNLTSAAGLANGACGLSDGSVAGAWRIPNRNELLSIIDISNVNPALPSGHPFVNLSNSVYTSSTTSLYSPTSYAWGVDVGSGVSIDTSSYKLSDIYLLPVRGGQ
jgi:hypothetical protein